MTCGQNCTSAVVTDFFNWNSQEKVKHRTSHLPYICLLFKACKSHPGKDWFKLYRHSWTQPFKEQQCSLGEEDPTLPPNQHINILWAPLCQIHNTKDFLNLVQQTPFILFSEDEGVQCSSHFKVWEARVVLAGGGLLWPSSHIPLQIHEHTNTHRWSAF